MASGTSIGRGNEKSEVGDEGVSSVESEGSGSDGEESVCELCSSGRGREEREGSAG